uniref:Uncharacterized protein n=1 Tax=Panagrolaimus sp. ES5 TaxID=591445 RepID=A0AC34GHM6_9BILA
MSSEDDASVSTDGDDAIFSEKSDPSDSEDDDGEESTPPRRRKRKLSTDDSFSSDDSYKKKKKRKKAQKKPAKSKSTPRTPKDVKKVVYKEDESESEEDEESEADDADLLEDGDTLMTEVSTMHVDDNNAETIEKVLKHREGIPGAVGPPTTAYNVEEKGDPNKGVEGMEE